MTIAIHLSGFLKTRIVLAAGLKALTLDLRLLPIPWITGLYITDFKKMERRSL